MTENRFPAQGFGLGNGAHSGRNDPSAAVLIHGICFAQGQSPCTKSPWRRPRHDAWGASYLLPGDKMRHISAREPCILLPDTGTLSTSSPPLETVEGLCSESGNECQEQK